MLAIKGIFYQFYDVICRHCESIVLLKRCYLLEKNKLHTFIKSQFLNFPNFQHGQFLSKCLGFDLNLVLNS